MNKYRLQLELLKKNLPLCGLAKAIGIERSTLSRYINEWVETPSQIKEKIARFFDLQANDFWPPEEKMEKEK